MKYVGTIHHGIKIENKKESSVKQDTYRTFERKK